MSRRASRVSLALAVSVWVVVRVVQVRWLGLGTGIDVGIFLHYAQQWVVGSPASVALHPEYPPAALPFFLLPLVVGGTAGYVRAFAIEMACFDLAACVLIVKCAALRGPRWPRPLLASLLYTFMTAGLYPVLYARFDLVPAVLVLGALYCLHRSEPGASGMLLGVAGAVKLWPFALVPVWLAWTSRRGGTRRLASVGGWIAVGALVATVLPLVPRPNWPARSFFEFQAARGIQIESMWATVAFLLARVGLVSLRPEFAFGASQIAGDVPSAFAVLSMPLVVALALAPQAFAIVRDRRRGQGGGSTRAFDHAVLGGVLGVMIAAKVLSPQFILWIAPLLPLAVEGPAGAFGVLALGLLTTLGYPYLAPALEQRVPGHGWALLVLGARNLLLVAWYAVALSRAGSGPESPSRI